MDYKEFTGEGLPAPPDQRLRGLAMSLHDHAHVLHPAPEDPQPHLFAGTLVQGKPLKRFGSLVALGGRPCIGLCARPHFAARGAMKTQLERLSLHCVAKWQQRLRTPAQQRVRQDYFPVPVGGREALRPGQRQPGRPQPGRPGCPPPPPAAAETEATIKAGARLPTGLATSRSAGGATAGRARPIHRRRSVPAARGPSVPVVQGVEPRAHQML